VTDLECGKARRNKRRLISDLRGKGKCVYVREIAGAGRRGRTRTSKGDKETRNRFALLLFGVIEWAG
jgi:hypothetical protein